MRALDPLPATFASVPATVLAGVPKLPVSTSTASVTAVPPEQVCPAPGLVTVPLTLIEPAKYVVFVGTRSEIVIFVAVAPPAPFATEMQYSTIAPGTDLKLLVLTLSLMIRLVLKTLNTAAETV